MEISRRILLAIVDNNVKGLYDEFVEDGTMKAIFGSDVDIEYFKKSLISYSVSQDLAMIRGGIDMQVAAAQKRHGTY